MAGIYDLLITSNFLSNGGGIQPTGTINIDANGIYDVTQYASAEVAVPMPVGTLSITSNGDYNVENYANVSVAVSAPSSNKLPAVTSGTATDLTASDLAGVVSTREYAFAYVSSLVSCEFPEGFSLLSESTFY